MINEKQKNLEKVWLSSPHMGTEELEYIKEAFSTNWIAPLGPHVTAFESSIKKYIGNNREVACLSSGTAALHLALILAGVSQGDYVICQSFTFSASANPISYLGATPVFIDSERTTWNLCPEQLERAIKDLINQGKKPRAIVAVHLYGMPYQVDEIERIATEYDIKVIEDSAEALGSTYFGKNCGTFGDYGIFSFNGNKIITTSGGGAMVVKDESTKNEVVHLATQARDQAPHYQHSKIGYNYRLSNVLAGIGLGQMGVLDDRVNARRSNFEFYSKNLGDFEEIEFLQEPSEYFSNRWLTCILGSSFEQRELIRTKLAEKNLESRPLWKPMHLQPVFEDTPSYNNGVSEDLFNRGLCLPSGSNLNEETLAFVCETLKSALK